MLYFTGLTCFKDTLWLPNCLENLDDLKTCKKDNFRYNCVRVSMNLEKKIHVTSFTSFVNSEKKKKNVWHFIVNLKSGPIFIQSTLEPTFVVPFGFLIFKWTEIDTFKMKWKVWVYKLLKYWDQIHYPELIFPLWQTRKDNSC